MSVPEPEGILATMHLAHPDRAWGRFQPLLAKVLGFKPVSLSATLTDVLGIPAAYSPGIAIEQPMVGLLVDGAPPRAIVGIRMTSGREILAALSTGRNPTHRARPLNDGRVTLLEPLQRDTVSDLAMGVCGNSLLVGAHGADLAQYGPYVARELPARLAPKGKIGAQLPTGSLVVRVPQKTLNGPIVSRLRKSWQATKERLQRQARDQQHRHGDRAPDFAEPEAVIAGGERLARGMFGLFRSAGALTIIVEPSRTDVRVRATVGAGARGPLRAWLDQLPAGDGRTLLRLPRTTLAALAVHSTPTGRTAFSELSTTALVELFGARLAEAHRSIISRAFTAPW